MPRAETIAKTGVSDLQERVSVAINDRAAPISELLRLYWALSAAQDAANQNGVLRQQLRARIGGPFPV